MKKKLFYLVLLLTFFIGISDCLCADINIKNYGVLDGTNSYTCGGNTKSILDLRDVDGINYYTKACTDPFPCDESDSNNTCVGSSEYIYTETLSCYVTCDELSLSPSNASDIENNQTTIWNNFSNYKKTSCSEDRINLQNLESAMNELISDNYCRTDSNFYILQEYTHTDDSSNNVVSIKTVNDMCKPQIKIKKECSGFSEGTFNIKVGEEIISLSCGETSDPIDVIPDTPIAIEEINSEEYMVYYSSNLLNGTIEVNHGTETVIITNAVGSVNLTKTNGTNNSPMEDIEFKLEKLVDGEWVEATDYKGDIIPSAKTNYNGKLSFSGLLKGKYRIVEVSNSNGNYIVSDPEPFEINKDSVDSNFAENVNIVNNPLKLKLIKVSENGVVLNDSVFLIEKLIDGNKRETVTPPLILENGEIEIYLEKTGHYFISERQAPIGYDLLNSEIVIELENGIIKNQIIDEKYVKINKENNLLTIEIINDKSKIKFYKKDSATNNIIAGAKLALKKADGTLVQEIITGNGAFATTLEPGKYLISEIEAPKGYEKLKENFEFVVKDDGTIEAITNSGLFEIVGMNINIYNVKPTKVPDTGVGINILLTVIGVSLLGGGSYLVYKNVKKRKNDK